MSWYNFGERKFRSSGPNDGLKRGIEEEKLHEQFTFSLERNESILMDIFRNCGDLVRMKMLLNDNAECLIVYIESLIDKKMLEDYVLVPLQSNLLLPAGQISQNDNEAASSSVSAIVKRILDSEVAILHSDSNRFITISCRADSSRSIGEPTSEQVIRGPKDGFIEQLSANVSLIRARLKTSALKIEYVTVGELTHTKIAIAYLKGIALDSLVDEVKRRIEPIRLNGILDSGYIEELIEDQPFSPFPQVHSTERPDVASAELLEGKIAILVDQSPFVLIVPMTFWTGLQASEDYYIRWPIATFIRWIRFLFINLAIFAPPLYVAVTTFHQEMIPPNLVLSIAASREAVPFPALIEALLMEIIFEALREAGIRLPKQIGQAISIVGGLVIGQAAVQAGLISAPVVIIVSLTGISAFTIPRYSFANGIRLIRFPMLFLAGTLGLYGIVLGFLCVMLHITSLRSFGVLYFSPATPFRWAAVKDVFFRMPLWTKARFTVKGKQERGNS